MKVLNTTQQSFFDFLKNSLPEVNIDKQTISFALNVDESKAAFGDISSNAAMVLAKQCGKNPRDIAQQVIAKFKHPFISKVEMAGPGFLNFFLTSQAFIDLALELFEQPQAAFTLEPSAPKKRFSLEFVSANPTGPLHLGHGRGGIIGDVLGNVWRFLGHQVTKEFYINDAGSQIEKLGISFNIRCQQILGVQATIPEDGYHGDYLIALAQECVSQQGKELLQKDTSFFADYAKNKLLEQIKATLTAYGITFDLWFSEKTLHTSGAVTNAIKQLTISDNTYEQDGALWFKSTKYGDDKDRVLRKSNGELTYMAAEVAYNKNKLQRADHATLVLGQDHHSYAIRLKGVTQALGYPADAVDAILYQLVTLKASDQILRMSKRAGTMVMLQEIIDTVGKDVARFFFLNRKADTHLEFDIDLALKKTEENPVYYIQYAYVRTNSILQKATTEKALQGITSKDAQGLGVAEQALIKKIASLQELLATIGTTYQTHLLTYYVLELAQSFHRYYSNNRVINLENIPESRARLLMITLLHNTFDLCLTLLGLDRPESM